VGILRKKKKKKEQTNKQTDFDQSCNSVDCNLISYYKE